MNLALQLKVIFLEKAAITSKLWSNWSEIKPLNNSLLITTIICTAGKQLSIFNI